VAQKHSSTLRMEAKAGSKSSPKLPTDQHSPNTLNSDVNVLRGGTINQNDSMDNQTHSKTHPPKRLLWGAGALILVLMLAGAGIYLGYYLLRTCAVHAVQEASSFLNSQRTTFDKEYQFATTVARDSLALPVMTLEKIWLDTKSVSVPACVQT